MKRTKLVAWLSATLLYSYLFYNHSAGINFLILNVVLIALVFFLQPGLRTRKSVVAIAAGCLLTAINVAWHPTWAALLMNIVSLMGLSGLSRQPEGSLVVAWVNSSYSLVASGIRHTFGRFVPLTGLITPSEPKAPTTVAAGITVDKLVSRSVPILGVAVFFVLYTQASPAFSALFTGISLDFISVWWVVFTLFGAYLLLVFFYPMAIRALTRADQAALDALERHRRSTPGTFNVIGLRYEYRSGWLLLVMLNALLLFFNAVDIFYLITVRLPEGITYSAFLHQGVNTLIASVVLAIVIVMYFFRGNLNFLRNNRRLKYVAYLWIAQNAVLVVATAVKNFSYVSEYGLTYKRIGVYVYLLLTLIGLVTTYVKVRDIKSNWFLFRKNAWIFYGILVLFSLVSWSRVITQYNLAYLEKKSIDVDYLLSLSSTNLDLLAKAQSTYAFHPYQTQRIREKIDYFREQERTEEWPSWNYSEYVLYQRAASQPLIITFSLS